MTEPSSPALSRRYLLMIAAFSAAAAAMLVVLLWAKARSFEQVASLLSQVELRKDYEEQVLATTIHLIEMQSARRGYVLTGDPASAVRFDAAAGALARRVASIELQRSQVFDAAALPRWDTVRKALTDYEAHLRESVATRRDRPQDGAAQQEFTRVGETLAEPIYAELIRLERDVEARFEAQMKALLTGSASLQQRDAWLSGAGLLVLLGAFALALHAARERGRAQHALAAANNQLETKVRERTAALRDSTQRYRQLVELSADALFLCGTDRRIVFANAAAVELTRSGAAAALRGVDVASLFAPADQRWLADWLELLWAAPRRHGYRPAELCRHDGARLPVQIGAVSYEGPGGMQAQIVVQDMSLLLQEQAATREQFQFIDQLVDAIPAPLAVRDEQGRYLRINRAYALMHQCSAEQARNRSLFDVLPYALAQQVAQQDATALRSEGAIAYEVTLTPTRPGARELLSHAVAVRRPEGSAIGVITVDTDVTALRQQDRELHRINAELEALSQRLIRAQEDERRRIARDLHDDVGQLLTLLKMSLQGVVAGSGGDGHGLDRALKLTEDALQHARNLTASLHPHGLEDLGLEAAVRHLADHYVAGAIGEIEISIALVPPRSTADREIAAFRVVQEACTNAVKHAGASRLTIEAEAADGRLLLAISDDGAGFDPGSTVFDRQQKASLGIASMRERVAEIGGEFGIESTPDGGTSVRALLPW
jgi:two-component system, NarL family, sensor histidine kinase UhpB